MVTTACRLPAEWERQSAVQLTWPRAEGDFGARLDAVEPVFAAIAAAVSRRQHVLIACADTPHQTRIAEWLRCAGAVPARVRYAHAQADDVWARDHGPITVLHDGRPVLLDFRFNGWGGKYPAPHDDALTACLHAQGAYHATPRRAIDFVLEGGAIDSDGGGTLLTTAQCLLAPTRNPGYGRDEIERHLSNDLGITRVLWLEHGALAGDDTDGHIDTLARFCNADTIAYQSCDDPRDDHHAPLQAMAAELAALRTADGRPYHLIPLPWPAAQTDEQKQRLPASYANFLIINEAVLVPVYGDPADAVAVQRLGAVFPGRSVIEIPCTALIQQFGSLHCVTMQLPAGVLAEPGAVAGV